MLVLSRKVGEKIVIGNNITIVVQRVGKGRVALAIDAPHSVSVLRGELAPFGIAEDGRIEFIDGELEDEEHVDEVPPSARPNIETSTRPLSRMRAGNNRLREEASTRTGFPPSSPALNPTSELGAARLPRSLPSR